MRTQLVLGRMKKPDERECREHAREVRWDRCNNSSDIHEYLGFPDCGEELYWGEMVDSDLCIRNGWRGSIFQLKPTYFDK